MKNAACLLLLTFCFFPQSLSASSPAAKSPDHGSLPHAFDAGWKGQKTCELLFEDETARIGRCIFPPGVGHEKHFHRPHFGYVLEGGTLLIRDDQGERTVNTVGNASWSTSTFSVHEAVNIGDTTTRYLIVEPKTP